MASYACERHHMWRMQAARSKNVMLQTLFYSETSSIFQQSSLSPHHVTWECAAGSVAQFTNFGAVWTRLSKQQMGMAYWHSRLIECSATLALFL